MNTVTLESKNYLPPRIFHSECICENVKYQASNSYGVTQRNSCVRVTSYNILNYHLKHCDFAYRREQINYRN